MRSEGADRVTLCLKERAFRKILEQARAAFFFVLLFSFVTACGPVIGVMLTACG